MTLPNGDSFITVTNHALMSGVQNAIMYDTCGLTQW